MDLSIGTLELNRSNVAHLGGLPPLDGVIKVDPNAKTALNSGEKVHGSFEEYLLSAIDQLNSQQVQVSKLREQVITDPESVDIHDVSISMAKAQMSLNLAQTVIDRLVKGWNDLSQNR